MDERDQTKICSIESKDHEKKFRVVDNKMLKQGYFILHDGVAERREYRVIEKLAENKFKVEEP